MSHIHSIPEDIPREGDQQNQQINTPQQPLESSRDPGNYWQHKISFQFPPPGSSTKSAPVFTTRQQHQISISFQLLPPDCSAKSASASSFYHQATTQNQLPVSANRQQHHISQPPARHPANQLLTLLPCHTHTMAARSIVV